MCSTGKLVSKRFGLADWLAICGKYPHAICGDQFASQLADSNELFFVAILSSHTKDPPLKSRRPQRFSRGTRDWGGKRGLVKPLIKH